MAPPGAGELEPIPPGVGVVAPYDLALDRELWRWTPAEVSLYVTRTPPPEEATRSVERARSLGDLGPVRAACAELRVPAPAVTAFLCASCSFARGVEGERELRAAMREGGAAEAITTSGALLEALAALGAERVAIATPYDEPVTALLARFLGEADITVTGSANLGMDADIWRLGESAVRELVGSIDPAGAQAIFLSCTNLPTQGLIASLERELGLPVLSANQVTIWAALRRLGLAPAGEGELLFEAGPR